MTERHRWSGGWSARVGLAMAALATVIAALPVAPSSARAEGRDDRVNPQLLELPRGRWVKLHDSAQAADPTQRVVRQAHGGSAFDTRRGRLILFGSDTHGEDWSNAIRMFDLVSLRWTQAHADNPPETYRVNEDGVPVAGVDGRHPWAMHGFGALDYDARQDRLVVATWPDHLRPGRFTDAMAPVWNSIRVHPTWLYSFSEGAWRYMTSAPARFFASAIVYDSHRGLFVGQAEDGFYEFTPTAGWHKVADGGLLSWGSNAVYDSRQRAVVVFGSHERRNDVAVFYPETRRHGLMPTPGSRPPATRYVPMAFHEAAGQTAVVVDMGKRNNSEAGKDRTSETWLYDLGADRWKRIASASLAFGIGMNFNLEYDPRHRLLLLVADEPMSRVPVASPPPAYVPGYASVWALRL